MTAKFLNNYPAKNALRIISQNQKFFIIMSILFLLGIPLAGFTGLLDAYLEALEDVKEDYYSYFSCEPYMVIACFCGGIAVLMGMFCGIRAYEEEWNKTRVDMLYALPLNDTQRFFSNYSGGLFMYLAPYLASVILGWLMMFIMVPMITRMDAGLAEDVGNLYLYYFLASLGLGVLMWMFYTISALCASCCGTMFENIYTNLLLNVLIPGTFAAVLAAISNQVNGIEFEYSWNFIGYMSPIGGVIYMIYVIFENGLDSDYYYASDAYKGYGGTPENSGLIPVYIRWIIAIIIITIALTVLAWKLYQHRKAEQVGMPFVYSWIYYIILTSVTVCILCIATADEDFLAAALIFSAIVYFIMEVIRKRGFKKFWMSVITYIATVAVSAGVFILAIQTDCFGRTNYIPATAGVTSLEVDFDGNIYGRSAGYHLNYKENDIISAVRDLQKDIINNHSTRMRNADEECKKYPYELSFNMYADNSYDSDYEYYGFPDDEKDYTEYFSSRDLTLTYHTIAGTTIHRRYHLMHDEYNALMKIVTGTDAYAEAQSSLLKNRLINNMRSYDDHANRYMIPAISSLYVTLFPTDTDSAAAGHQIILHNVESSVETLKEAYYKDLKNLSYESYCKDEIIGYIKYFPIFKSCTETVNLLKNWGFEEFTPEEMTYLSIHDTNQIDTTLRIQFYAPENYHTASFECASYLECVQDKIIIRNSYPDYEDVILTSQNEKGMTAYSEFLEILSNARQHYISDGKCYLLTVNGENYLIPESDTEKVQKLIDKGNDYYYNKVIGVQGTSQYNAYNF